MRIPDKDAVFLRANLVPTHTHDEGQLSSGLLHHSAYLHGLLLVEAGTAGHYVRKGTFAMQPGKRKMPKNWKESFETPVTGSLATGKTTLMVHGMAERSGLSLSCDAVVRIRAAQLSLSFFFFFFFFFFFLSSLYKVPRAKAYFVFMRSGEQ